MEGIDATLESVYVFQLVRASQAFKLYARNFLAQHNIDVTSDQWVLLKRISEVGDIKQSELAESVYKDPASVTRILDVLEKKELVDRKKGADRRVYQIGLTFRGQKLVERVLQLAVEIRKKGLEGLTDEEVVVFKKGLNVVFQNFRA